MPIDASIALGVKPLQIDSPLNALANALQVQSLQRQNQLGDYQLQEEQAKASERAALRNYLARPDVNLDTAEGQRGLYGIAPTQAPTILKGRQDIAKSVAETKLANSHAGEFDASAAQKALSMQRDALSMVRTPEQFASWIDGMYANPATAGVAQSFGTPEQMKERIPSNPQEFQQFLEKNALGMDKYIANKTQIRGQDLTRQSSIDTNATSRANNASTNATSRANNQANIQKDYTIAGIDANGQPVEGGGLLSPQAIINAATRYQIDGTLPPNLGRGAQGPRQTSQILNEAARQAAERGDSPEAQRITQLANKSSASALTKLETQQTMVGAFEKNFAKNADIAQELSNKVDRTGIPLVNKWVNAGKRSISGDPDISAFDASVKATVNEYGKIVGGGTGSSATAQGEIAKIEGLLNAAQTKEQVKSVLDLMRRETANRMTAFEDQKNELKSGMIRPKAAAAPASAAGAHPADIQSLLDKYGK